MGWNILGKYGYEGIPITAIDQDWSTLQFRKVDYITTL